MIFDTDILIWFLRGNENARKAVLDNSGFSISAVTYMELVQGMKNKRELQIMKKMINSLGVKVLPITPQITYVLSNLKPENYVLCYLVDLKPPGSSLIIVTSVPNGGR